MKVSHVKFNKHIAGDYEIQFRDIGGGSDEYDSLPKTFSFDLYYNPAVTTEKDAARLTQFSNLDEKIQKNIYTLPIEVRFLQNQEEAFNQNIIEYVRKNKRDSSFPEREDAY